MERKRAPTRTSSFGVSRRESHDASDFYARFTAPVLSTDETVNPCPAAGKLFVGDSRDMSEVPDSSVALVVTSPPYFAAKDYEIPGSDPRVPESYTEYLAMLRDVFLECFRVLEPGGRIAVNVAAGLGRRPYRSLSSDVIRILEDDCRAALRGVVVWSKAAGASGSCAWGSFMSPSNPTLRDLTERIVIASKGRFDRAIRPRARQEMGLPWEATITKEDFMAWTLDVWHMPAESARRTGHPAPFPVELPRRCIELYTYAGGDEGGDVVLDPFLGSGSTAVAAVRTGRRYVGYDLDPDYIALAEARLAEAERHLAESGEAQGEPDWAST